MRKSSSGHSARVLSSHAFPAQNRFVAVSCASLSGAPGGGGAPGHCASEGASAYSPIEEEAAAPPYWVAYAAGFGYVALWKKTHVNTHTHTHIHTYTKNILAWRASAYWEAPVSTFRRRKRRHRIESHMLPGLGMLPCETVRRLGFTWATTYWEVLVRTLWKKRRRHRRIESRMQQGSGMLPCRIGMVSGQDTRTWNKQARG